MWIVLSADPSNTRQPGRHIRPSSRKYAFARIYTHAPFLLVVLLGLAVFSQDVGRPGLWRDEAATIAICPRSLGQLVQFSRNLDLVHLAYYLLAQVAWQIDNSVTAVRLISVLAMSLTAGMLVLIGRRLGSVRVGILAGLLLVVNPFASRYAQEARPFATVALLATISTYLLLALLPNPSRRNQVAYATSLALLGLFNVLALMLVLAHAGQVWWTGDRQVRRRWALATAAGLAVISPFVLLSFTQRGQVSWIETPHLYDLRSLLTLEFGSRHAPLVVAVALLAALGVRYLSARGGWSRWSGWASTPAKRAIVLGIGWSVAPPIVLFAISQVLPLWDVHYLLFSLPGLALLLAGLCPSLDSRSALRSYATLSTAVVLMAALGFSDQIAYRDPVTGHQEDLLSVSAQLGEEAKRGDAVLFVPTELRVLTEVSPQNFANLDDVALDQQPIGAANLVGTPIDTADLVGVLKPHQRVWLVEGLFKHRSAGVDKASLTLLANRFEEVETRTTTDVRVTLYTRASAHTRGKASPLRRVRLPARTPSSGQ